MTLSNWNRSRKVRKKRKSFSVDIRRTKMLLHRWKSILGCSFPFSFSGQRGKSPSFCNKAKASHANFSKRREREKNVRQQSFLSSHYFSMREEGTKMKGKWRAFDHREQEAATIHLSFCTSHIAISIEKWWWKRSAASKLVIMKRLHFHISFFSFMSR